MKDIHQARIAGYEYGLRQAAPESDYETDGAIVRWYGCAPVPAEIEGAWYQGFRDSGAPDLFDFISPEDAAARKRINPRTILRILDDNQRRMKNFPRATSSGQDRHRTWKLHIQDVDDWTPKAAGRPKND
jgi:hypothetical protein